MTRPRAIDLYSGIGGWTLGLAMAGIETVESYEWWDDAVRTYRANFSRDVGKVDIRSLSPDELPRDVRYVVGSPPCTEFSFSNRGGNGDIRDGLTDIAKFLELVEAASPKYWVMENVPRVAGILRRELSPGGRLKAYRGLVEVITVVDMAEYGLPQRRRRMLAGRFPLDLLDAYKSVMEPKTLGRVLDSLRRDPPEDPVFGTAPKSEPLTQNEPEEPLDDEELRMNREAKRFHPFYNLMSFPDALDRPARTVTATCTRVSRESIVIPGQQGGLRRLTLRERATLQGFPLSFRLFGSSYTANQKLIGNALPPPMAFYVAHSLLETPVQELPSLSTVSLLHSRGDEEPPVSMPPRRASRYSKTRKFRAALPNLRFGSGVRFELANRAEDGQTTWNVSFYFGTSKRIQSTRLDAELLRTARRYRAFAECLEALNRYADKIDQRYVSCSAESLQRVWTHAEHGLHPFELVDDLGDLAVEVHDALSSTQLDDIERFVLSVLEDVDSREGPTGLRNKAVKIRRWAPWILAGMLSGAWFNSRGPLNKG